MTLAGATISLISGGPFPPGTTWAQASAQFDAACGRTEAQAGQKTYLQEGSFPTSISGSGPVNGTSARIHYLASNGLGMFISVEPSRSKTAAQRSALGAFLDLLLANGFTRSNCWVTLWQEANGANNGVPFFATGADYISYVAYYGPTVQSRFDLYFDPALQVGKTQAQVMSYYQSGLFDGICVDYYGNDWVHNNTQADYTQAQANADGIPWGIGEYGAIGQPAATPPTQAQWSAYMAKLQSLCTAQQATAQGCPFVLYYNGVSVNANNVAPSSGTTYDKAPALQQLYDALRKPGTTSPAFTFVQASQGLTQGSGGLLPLSFNQTSGAASTAGTLLAAAVQTEDGAQAVTPPSGWWVRASVTDGTGTTGQSRTIIYGRRNNPGGLAGQQSYTATSASPCVLTAGGGTAPAAGAAVQLTGSVPTGFTASTVYYVVSPSGATFELAATAGGTAINSTSAVTTGGVLLTPEVFTYSNTAAVITGGIAEFSTPAGTIQQHDRSGTASGGGNNTAFNATAGAANTYTGELGIAAAGAHYSANPSGQSLTHTGWTSAFTQLNGFSSARWLGYQAGEAAGTASLAATLSPAPTAMTGWTTAIVTFYAVSSSPPSTTTTALPAGQAGVAYSASLAATGGTTPYAWSHTGTLPAGLSLSTAGALSGTPAAAGSYPVTFTVTDANSLTDSVTITMIVVTALSVTTTSPLPGGTTGTPYSVSLAAAGGQPPYSWAPAGGSLAPGLGLSAAGALTGVPVNTGTFTFTAKVTDSLGLSATKSLAATITAGALTITTTGLADGIAGQSYDATFTEAGGTGPFTWAVTAGTLPPGLSLNPSTGELSGTPTAPGTYNFTIQVTG